MQNNTLDTINFVETNSFKILDDLIIRYEKASNEILYPGDERRLFLNQFALIFVSFWNQLNINIKQNYLRYATKYKLDLLGEMLDVTRLPAKKAKSKIEFTLSQIQKNDIIISKGTKLTPDGIFIFETTEDLKIKSGELTGITNILAINSGYNYNNFSEGQIKNLIEPIPYIEKVSNIIKSYDGADEEDDDRFRERIRLAPNSFSTAGPEEAYKFHTLSSDNNIKYVSVFSPSPGVVRLIVLLKNGDIPTKEILDNVLNYVSAKDKRPLTDKVEVCAPEKYNYDIKFKYHILRENQVDESNIKEKVNNAVKEYILWQKSTLGREINPDYLRKLVLNAGANRIIVESPAYTVPKNYTVAIPNSTDVTYGGLE